MDEANPIPPVVAALAASDPSSQARRDPGSLGVAASSASRSTNATGRARWGLSAASVRMS